MASVVLVPLGDLDPATVLAALAAHAAADGADPGASGTSGTYGASGAIGPGGGLCSAHGLGGGPGGAHGDACDAETTANGNETTCGVSCADCPLGGVAGSRTGAPADQVDRIAAAPHTQSAETPSAAGAEEAALAWADGLAVEWFDRARLRGGPLAMLAVLSRAFRGPSAEVAILVAPDLSQPRLRLTSLLLALPRARHKWRIDVLGRREPFSVRDHIARNAWVIVRHALGIALAAVLGEPVLRALEPRLTTIEPDAASEADQKPTGTGAGAATSAITVLYLRAQLWLGLSGGGSVAHTAGVIGGLQAAGAEVVVVSSDDLAGVTVPTTVVPPETWFDGRLRELEELVYMVPFARAAMRVARGTRASHATFANTAASSTVTETAAVGATGSAATAPHGATLANTGSSTATGSAATHGTTAANSAATAATVTSAATGPSASAVSATSSPPAATSDSATQSAATGGTTAANSTAAAATDTSAATDTNTATGASATRSAATAATPTRATRTASHTHADRTPSAAHANHDQDHIHGHDNTGAANQHHASRGGDVRRRATVLYQRHTTFNCSGALLRRVLGWPLILEFNSSEVWKGQYWGGLHRTRLARLVERINLGAADTIVVVSRVLRDSLVQQGVPAAKILVNPNAVDPDVFGPQVDGSAIRARLGLAPDAIVVGFSGTFGQWHGIPTLAAALAPVLEGNAKTSWLLIGDGPLRPVIDDAVQADRLGARVHRTGLVPHAAMPAFLAACDIVVSPHGRQADGGEFFGSPTKLFEYMASARPIVASAVGQIADVLEDERTALLTPPDDPAALAEAVLRLASDADLRRRLGASARQTAIERHTWRQNAERVLAAATRAAKAR